MNKPVYVAGLLRGAAVELARNRLIERVVDQRGFAGAGYASYANEQAERQLERDVLEIVAAGTDHAQLAIGIGRRAHQRQRDHAPAGKILAGE